MAVDVRRFIFPFVDLSVSKWAWEARVLRWLTLLWLVLGLLVLYSASYSIAIVEHGDGLYYFKRQALWAIVGLVGFNCAIHTPLRSWLKIAPWMVFGILGLLVLVLVPGLGTTVNGATRWISIGIVPIQPSELIKPFLILQAASLFGRWNHVSLKVRLTWIGIWGVILVGILLQPNLSTTALCGMMLWLMALAAGLSYQLLGGTAAGGLILATLSVSINEYQRRRILSFLNPWASPDGDGYQLIQSLLAVASGGPWGTGFGLSQQKIFYLPIQYSDFIFSVFAEEFGFIGSLVLLLLLGSYATLSLLVAFKAKNLVYQLVAIGVMVIMVGQSLVNIGVATGVLPTTGLPFPLFSYGGSSSIATLLAAGLLIRVARESGKAKVIEMSRARSGQPKPGDL
ncbi:MAG TPA: FtsW/RodA/SpoVE family cell cycle protein [Oscillatoriales cyanobacterium M59_W2019_021]|nr:MAG: FtsW/RodA/SpoVE family cell cycle protein [Cyanobacteria bacterium J055]HIK32256.1 FtsW/RodA/SpoVE family cell cycle protein [Oscillatoriales cyanobacterium M4454_W2019_049]HIK49466.1 FtsW/RodA/SpoVE family cell cycle protein [Oscillatoriales cyanobacterium M59_W2019_021]